MDNNNWWPAGGKPTKDTGDWRGQLPPDSRQEVVNKIVNAFKRLLPFSGQEGLRELEETAVRTEEYIYAAATSKPDYIRRLYVKMLKIKNMAHSRNAMPNSVNGNKPPVPRASHSMQPQVHKQSQSLPIPSPTNQSQACQHLLSQNMHNMTSTGVPSSVGLQPAVAFVSGLNQTSVASASRQNPTMQNIVSVPQNSVSNAMGQNVPADMYANAQGQMPGRQQVVPQQQPQSQNHKAIQETPSSPDGAHRGSLTTASGKSSVTEQPLERLIKMVKSMSPDALRASVNDIGSVISMIDRIAGRAPVSGSTAALGEDLAAMTITRDGMTGTTKMKRYTSAMPMNVLSSAGSGSDCFKRLICPEISDLESTATSSVKRRRIEDNHALLEDIRKINQRLIDTVVDISDEDVDRTVDAAVADGGEGTIVKCSFSAVAMCPSLKSQYFSAQMSPIQPLRLLVPKNYPNCSPVLLDKLPVEVSKEYEDFSVKTKSKLSIFLRSLSQPMSLAEIARTWDVCARAVILEHAQQSGGGTFCSKYRCAA